MDRAKELQQARRIEQQLNHQVLEHVTSCGTCYDALMSQTWIEGECPQLTLLEDQLAVAAAAGGKEMK